MRGLALAVTIGLLGVVETARADTHRFDHTGSEQVFVVPAGVSEVSVVAVGGRGGAGKTGSPSKADVLGGFGAVARATLGVTPGQRLYVSVGGNGGDGYAAVGKGGFNGGGDGGVGSSDPLYNFGGGGGGASDVRTNTRSDPVGSVKLITAGGGGGGGNGQFGDGGPGGSAGSAGGNGIVVSAPCTAAKGGAPGTPVSPGQGGQGATVPFEPPEGGATGSDGSIGVGGSGGAQYYPGGGGGGGGGGLYGGGGGGGGAAVYPGNPNCTPGGGGGGSSGFAGGATNTSLATDQTGVPSVTFTYTPNPGRPGPSVTALSLTALSLTNRTFRVGPRPSGGLRRIRSGTAFRFTLSRAAPVTFAIARREAGRACGSKTQRNRQCVRYRTITTFTRDATAGRNRMRFSGLHGKPQQALPPGRYRATLRATDLAGNHSPPKQIGFRVVP